MKATAVQPLFPAPPKGRGFGRFVEAEPITRVEQLKVGDLLCEYNRQFNACNLICVRGVRHDGTSFDGEIVNPKDPSKAGIGTTGFITFCFWEFDPEMGSFNRVLHRATLDDGPKPRFVLYSGDTQRAVEATNTPEGRKMLEHFALRNGAAFMLEGTNPSARIIEITQTEPGPIPLMVEHFAY